MPDNSRVEVIELCGDLVESLGACRSLGEVFGALYSSAGPLTFADLAFELEHGVARLHGALLTLLDLGLVHRLRFPGGRPDCFVAETELERAIGVWQAGLSVRLESSLERLRTAEASVSRQHEPTAELLSQRLGTLRLRLRQASFVLPLIQRFLCRPGK